MTTAQQTPSTADHPHAGLWTLLDDTGTAVQLTTPDGLVVPNYFPTYDAAEATLNLYSVPHPDGHGLLVSQVVATHFTAYPA